MKESLIGLMLAVLFLTLGCQKTDVTEVQNDVTSQSTPSTLIVIEDVTPTTEQSAEIDRQVKAANDIDKFKDPAGYKQAYLTALEYASGVYPEPHPKLENLKQEIAFGEFLQGNTGVALKMLEDSLPVYVAGGAEYAERRLEIYNNLGVAYTQMGQSENAIPFLQKAVDEWRIKFADEPNVTLAKGLDNLAMAYNRIGNNAPVMDLNIEALEIIESLPESEDRNDQLVVLLGNRSKYLGELQQTEESLANSLALVGRLDDLLGPDHPRGVYALSSLAANLTQLRQFKSAEINARRAVTLREENYGKDTAETAVARNVLLTALLAQRKYEEAKPLADYNYKVLEDARGEAAEQSLVASEHRSRIAFAMGHVDEAIEIQKRNFELLKSETSDAGFDLQFAGDIYADMLLVSERYDEASDVLQELKAAEGLDGSKYSYHSLTMAQDLASAGQDPERNSSSDILSSEAWLDEKLAFELMESGNGGLSNISLRKSYGRALSAAFLRKKQVDAFRLMQKYNSGALYKAHAKRNLRQVLSRKSDQKRLNELQDLQELRSTYLKATFGAASKGEIDSVKEISEKLKEAEVNISKLSKVLESKIDPARVITPLTLEEAQQKLDPDSALIMISDTPYGVHVFALTSHGTWMETHDLSSTRAVSGRVADQLKSATPKTVNLQDFKAYGEVVLSASVRELIGNRSHVAVISRGSNSKVPLSVARISDGKKDIWAVEKYAFSYPSTVETVSNISSKSVASVENFVGVGYSSFNTNETLKMASADNIFRSVEDFKFLQSLPALPNAGTELREIQSRLKAESGQILADRKFSEADVRGLDLEAADVLTFATHGVMANEFDSLNEAALIVSAYSDAGNLLDDGMLTSSEISNLKLSAEWVILSACNSGAGDAESGEALSGLATAFTYAGGKSLLVSHWPVRDDAAAFLTVNTIENSQAGMSKPQALQKAINDLRENNAIPGSSHPSLWAPFVLVGQ